MAKNDDTRVKNYLFMFEFRPLCFSIRGWLKRPRVTVIAQDYWAALLEANNLVVRNTDSSRLRLISITPFIDKGEEIMANLQQVRDAIEAKHQEILAQIHQLQQLIEELQEQLNSVAATEADLDELITRIQGIGVEPSSTSQNSNVSTSSIQST